MMGVYAPLPPLDQWTPLDVARNIINQTLDQFPEVTVERRQQMNDPLDRFVSGLLGRWLTAQMADFGDQP
jgi:hypothetical protein